MMITDPHPIEHVFIFVKHFSGASRRIFKFGFIRGGGQLASYLLNSEEITFASKYFPFRFAIISRLCLLRYFFENL